ncbi:GAG-binding domain-containing protein, partial [Streptococcus equinus]
MSKNTQQTVLKSGLLLCAGVLLSQGMMVQADEISPSQGLELAVTGNVSHEGQGIISEGISDADSVYAVEDDESSIQRLSDKIDEENNIDSEAKEILEFYPKIQELEEFTESPYKFNAQDAPARILSNLISDKQTNPQDLVAAFLSYANYAIFINPDVGHEKTTVETTREALEFMQKDYIFYLEKIRKETLEDLENYLPYIQERFKEEVSQASSVKYLKDLPTRISDFVDDVEREKFKKIIDQARQDLSKIELIEQDAFLRELEKSVSEDEVENVLREAERQSEVLKTKQMDVENIRKVYPKIRELEKYVSSYNLASNDAPGLEMKRAISQASDGQLLEVFKAYSRYDVLKEPSDRERVRKDNLSVASILDLIEKDYNTSLEDAKREELEKLRSFSRDIIVKFEKLIERSKSLTDVKELIPEQILKEVDRRNQELLRVGIDEAKRQVNDIPYLVNRDYYVEQLDQISSLDEIEYLLEKAKQQAVEDKHLFDEVQRAKERVTKLDYLSNEEKNNFKSALDDSKDIVSLQNLLDYAYRNNLSNVINQGRKESEEFENYVKEINQLPDLPSNSYYAYQKQIWDESSKIGKSRVNRFRQLIQEKQPSLEAIKPVFSDLEYYKNHALIELTARKIQQLQDKFKDSKIEEIIKEAYSFNENSTYASMEGRDLRVFISETITSAYNKVLERSRVLEKLKKDITNSPAPTEVAPELEKNPAPTEVVPELEK